MNEPIRILQVVTHMNRGGLETMIMNYYRQIDRKKIQFDFLVHREARADYDDEIESLGGRIYRLPRLVPWSRTYLAALNKFFADNHQYRVIHVHQDCMSSVILKAAKKHHIPVRIAHSHSSSQDRNLKYPIKLFYKRLIPHYATDLIACGKDAGDWMFGRSPYWILKNAIHVDQYRFDPARAARVRAALGIPKDAIVVGHVGRFCTVKNHTFLIDIFLEIKKMTDHAVLLLVGSGDLQKSVAHKADSLGLSDSVIFTGLRSDVPDLMEAMDVFVFPSLYEGLPLTLVEAQSSGLGCVISDRIPSDCDLTPLVYRRSLEESPANWARTAMGCVGTHRNSPSTQIAAAGFDIADNARTLEQFYMERCVSC